MPITSEVPTSVFTGTFNDFDALAEQVCDWECDFKQASRGKLDAEFLQIIYPVMSLGFAHFDQKCLQTGASPRGLRTLALMDDESPETLFGGQCFDADRVALFEKDGQYESTSAPGFSTITLSFCDSWLANQAVLHGYPWNHQALSADTRVFEVNPGSLKPLREKVRNILRLAKDPKTERYAFSTLALEQDEIGRYLLDVLIGADGNEPEVSAVSRRRLLLTQAREYIHDHIQEPLKISDVARALGITTRTLEMVFRELLDVTPRDFLKTARLYGFRRNLRDAEPCAKISEVASQWGFWHMGQLAADYRSRFGELPSQTLHKT